MYIQPNSNIIICSGVPLDNSYQNTIYFESAGAQQVYFSGKAIKTFSRNSYQRVNSGSFEAACPADELYSANYMMFQNLTFGMDKWFYAFILSVEYVNNGNCRVNYEIDVMQTYLFDVDLRACYVEREHDDLDLVYSNLLPEPVALGEYVYEDRRQIGDDSLYDLDTVVQYVDIDNDATVLAANGFLINGVYNGCNARVFATGNPGAASPGGVANAINQFITSNIQKPEAIVNMYTCPHWVSGGNAVGLDISGAAGAVASKQTGFTLGQTFAPAMMTVDGYEIQNRKLMSYPYRYKILDNGTGQTLNLRYEFFNSNNMYVSVYGTMFSPVQMTLTPENYKNVTDLTTEQLTISNYPICSWNYDTYENFVARNTVPTILQGVGSVIGAASGGSVKAGAVGLIQQGLSIASEFYTASIAADQVRGNFYNGGVMFAAGMSKFYQMTARQPVEVIKTIDNFFTRYGYATNRVKIPNRNVRPHWTYTKTNGCVCVGSCPADDVRKIESIYDAGVTFWKNGDAVGQFWLDNRPA